MCGISGILSLKGNEIINKEEIYNKGVAEVSKEYECIVNFTQTELEW